MEAAALRPSPMARITVAAPSTMSPPAYTPFTEVRPAPSVFILPRPSTSRPYVVAATSGFDPLPTATITVSAAISNSLPSTGTGLRRPEASGSPSV